MIVSVTPSLIQHPMAAKKHSTAAPEMMMKPE
jgi:hypothetical protein